MSTEPARIFHLPGGTLRKGSPADVVVFDPTARWVVDPQRFLSKSRNTPFVGHELRGMVTHTILRGEPTVIDGSPTR